MTPAPFREAFVFFGAPPGLAEQQVATIPAWRGVVDRGSMEGSPLVVVAWKPDERELKAIAAGEPVFITFVGGIPPHYPSTSFGEATSPR